MNDLTDALNWWSGMEELSTCDRRHLRRIVAAARRWIEVEKALASDMYLEDQMEWISRITEDD